MKKIWEVLESKIKEAYHLSEPEWVQVDVSNRGKVHATVVTDQKISKDDIRSLVEDELRQSKGQYKIGFIDIYTFERAEEFRITKQEPKSAYLSWADALYAGEDVQDDKTELQVISFYSYKGGVGRTIALIQTAYNLAKAGKRVLLLDLDIEAPSLHNIFAERVNDELKGVKYGIIEYLYRAVVQKDKNQTIDDIFCSLQLEDVAGEMMLIPALKTMDKDYIYQIGRLQTQQVQEQNVFKEIFEYAREVFDIDTIMIDTRAGFNQWGSLSLLSLSNQVIFVAYPNAENIEGLNAALEMMENVGKRRYAVAMSKVVASEEGIAKARQLFEKLKIRQEELIPIFYREEIALSNSYPIVSKETLAAYRELSDYILDNERMQWNREFLASGRKEQMLKKLFCESANLVELSDVYRFSRQKVYMLLNYQYEEELYGLKNEKTMAYNRIGDVFVPIPEYSFVEDQQKRGGFHLEESWNGATEKMGLSIITEMMEHMLPIDGEKVMVPIDKESIQQFLDDISIKVPQDEMLIFDSASQMDSLEEITLVPRIKVFLHITESMLDQSVDHVIENIRGLITVFNKGTDSIEFKFMIQSSAWEKYKEDFGLLKGNMREIRIGRGDIERFLMTNIEKETFSSYDKYMSIHRSQGEERLIRINDSLMHEEEVEETLGIILGIRKNVTVYSSTVIEYLCEWLQKNDDKKYPCILECMKAAAMRELESPDSAYSDRLISYPKLRDELEKCI